MAMMLMVSLAAQGAPRAELWDRWLRHDPESAMTIDHSSWDNFLKAYVISGADGISRVRYGSVSNDDLARLREYIGNLENVQVSALNRDQQLVYWINLYNALTVDVILSHFPVNSIKDIDISPGWFSDGPWGKSLVTIEKEDITLDDIEHRILRPIWKDPRIHYAVNCASIGCPNLQQRAFVAENAEDLLEKAAKEYVNHGRGARIENGELIASSIYKWFVSDFGGNDLGVIEHLRKYAESDLNISLMGVESISDHEYDWTLNGAQ
jgi:hypothetical protein